MLTLDHVQLAIPADRDDDARGYFGDLLGLRELPKPAALSGRGGCWFDLGGTHLHLGVEEEFRPARKAHIALLTDDLAGLKARVTGAGYPIRDDIILPGITRFFSEDPFGNRIEFTQIEQSA